MKKPIIYHIPVCPFSQRVEILLARKGLTDAVDFHVIDLTQPRPDWLLQKTGGTTSLPVLETEEGGILKESLVILQYFEERWPDPQIMQPTPFERGIERLFVTYESAFGMAGYKYVMNTDRSKTEQMREALLNQYRTLGAMLKQHSPEGIWLFESFGLAEIVYTPLMMRFWFLEYYEDFQLPNTPEFERVLRWKKACLEHPDTQQVSFDEIVKLYYDYATGFGNGALPPARKHSSFVFEPHWRKRPMPPKDKYDRVATDAELGLLQ